MPSPSALPKFDDTFGAALIGSFVAAILFGVLCAQCYIFFQNSHGGTVYMKISVTFLLIFNIMHILCIIHTLYWFTITNFANPLVLLQGVIWSLPTTVFFTGCIGFVVQGWFTYRVWRLSEKNRLLALALSALTLIVFGSCMALTARLFQAKTFQEYTKANWLVYLGFGVTIATDFCIAITLCYLLCKLRSLAMRGTRSVVNYIMVYVINTGLLSCFLCVAAIVLRMVMHNTFVFVALFYPWSSLYSNALLGSLNARDWFRSGLSKGQSLIPLSNVASSRQSNARPIAFAPGDESTQESRVVDIRQIEVNSDNVKGTL